MVARHLYVLGAFKNKSLNLCIQIAISFKNALYNYLYFYILHWSNEEYDII